MQGSPKESINIFILGSYSSAHGEALDDLWEARRGCYHAAITYNKAKIYFTDGVVPMAQFR